MTNSQSEIMIIKSDTSELFILIFVFILAVMGDCILYPIADEKITIILLFCYTLGFVTFIIKEAIFRMRTLVFSKEGIAVSFIFYKKQYQWSDFKIKRMEYYGDNSYKDTNRHVTYTKGAYFCPYQLRKKVATPPAIAHTLHIFSLIYVNFVPSTRTGRFKGESFSYPVDEEIFLAKMKEWGVELEYLNPPRKRIGYNRHL